jgi:hypothetical protein
MPHALWCTKPIYGGHFQNVKLNLIIVLVWLFILKNVLTLELYFTHKVFNANIQAWTPLAPLGHYFISKIFLTFKQNLLKNLKLKICQKILNMNPFILYKNICYTYFESAFEYFKFIKLILKFEDMYINILYYIKTISFVSFEKKD